MVQPKAELKPADIRLCSSSSDATVGSLAIDIDIFSWASSGGWSFVVLIDQWVPCVLRVPVNHPGTQNLR